MFSLSPKELRAFTKARDGNLQKKVSDVLDSSGTGGGDNLESLLSTIVNLAYFLTKAGKAYSMLSMSETLPGHVGYADKVDTFGVWNDHLFDLVMRNSDMYAPRSRLFVGDWKRVRAQWAGRILRHRNALARVRDEPKYAQIRDVLRSRPETNLRSKFTHVELYNIVVDLAKSASDDPERSERFVDVVTRAFDICACNPEACDMALEALVRRMFDVTANADADDTSEDDSDEDSDGDTDGDTDGDSSDNNNDYFDNHEYEIDTGLDMDPRDVGRSDSVTIPSDGFSSLRRVDKVENMPSTGYEPTAVKRVY